jgi:Beta-propeller repeat
MFCSFFLIELRRPAKSLEEVDSMFNFFLRSMALCSALLSPALLAAVSAPTPFDRPLAFEPNLGQAPAQVSWTARGQGYQLFLTSKGASITLAESVAPSVTDTAFSLPANLGARQVPLLKGRISVMGMNLVGSHPWSMVQGLEPTGGVSNYLLGKDRKNWHSSIPQYGRIRVKNVYDGIDLVFYGHGSDLEYDFVVAPGGDPNQIRLAFDGVGPLHVDSKTGDLVIKTGSGSEIRHIRPRVYQQIGNDKVEVAGGYQVLDHGQAAFHLAHYDRRNPLVVDPTVEFTTFLHGNSQDYGVAVTVDAQGNSYVTGQTLSTDFPDTVGTPVGKNCVDNIYCPAYIFVTELSPAGAVLNSTLIGGSNTDLVTGIAVDATGVWVTGGTTSSNFGTHTQFGYGVWNGFVAKLTPDLTQLDWCATFGGFGDSTVFQMSYAIALDSNDNAYVTGATQSVDFPTSLYTSATLKPLQQALDGSMDAFIVKLGPDGYLTSGYSTYLGGEGYEIGEAIAVDSAGHAYVTGITSSLDFPINGAPSHGSTGAIGHVAFVTELSQDGSQSIYSVLLGGAQTSQTSYPLDEGLAIALDPADEAYIAGVACSSDFPTTAQAYQLTPPSPCLPSPGTNYTSAFVAKLGSTGQLLHATYLGAAGGVVQGNSLAINPAGDVYVAGSTTTGVFPGAPAITVSPSAGFLTEFGPKLEGLMSTTFLGAAINGISVFTPGTTSNNPAPQSSVFTTGYRYVFGSDTSNVNNQDAFVVELSDTP